jgi:signal peptide peptidase SppA
MIEALTLATSELWCIAPGHAAGFRLPPAELPPRMKPLFPFALVEIVGTLTKPRTVAMRQRIAAAAADPNIGELVLLVDSPGGTVAGVHDLYLTIAAAAKRKRVVAVIEDQATSGALYAIAGASEIVIGETALTGSIGVYVVAIDESKLLERIGVEVVIVRSGEHKGAGVQGAKLTPDQLAEVKRRVDVQARHFIAAVAKGRRMSVHRAAELADGRVFIGREAVAAGLADRVGMFEDVLAEIEGRTVKLMYRELRGADAAEKLGRLVAEEQNRSGDGEATCIARVSSRYVYLASAAREHEQAQEKQRARDRERWASRGTKLIG